MRTPLSEIRIHTGAESARLNRELGSIAATIGHDIYFAADSYAPDTAEGRALLAHELGHATGADSEQDAHSVATHTLAGRARPSTVSISGGPTTFRKQSKPADSTPISPIAIEVVVTETTGKISAYGLPVLEVTDDAHLVIEETLVSGYSVFRVKLSSQATFSWNSDNVNTISLTHPNLKLAIEVRQSSLKELDPPLIQHRVLGQPVGDQSIRSPLSVVGNPSAGFRVGSPHPSVTDVPLPVSFTPVADDPTKVSELLPADFSGYDNVKTFVALLSKEWARRSRPQLEKKELDRRRKEASVSQESSVTPEEKPAQKRRRINDAVASVAVPTSAEIDALMQAEEARRATDFQTDWERHLASPQAKPLKGPRLANAWMRNRSHELLYLTETVKRPADQEGLWSKVWLETEAAGAPRVESDPLGGGVDLGSVPGGREGTVRANKANVPLLIDRDAATFLTALRARFPFVRFESYANHGSDGFGGRGLSLDMYLTSRDPKAKALDESSNSEGFWERDHVLELLLAIDATAAELDFHFFAIYNDSSVSLAANAQIHHGTVGFAGGVDRGNSLNYHGGGIKLHVHVDLLPARLTTRSRPAKSRK